MASDLFISIIDLPKSQYYFANPVTFFQAFFGLLCVILVSIDTAIEDIICKIVCSIRGEMGKIGLFLGSALIPKMAYA